MKTEYTITASQAETAYKMIYEYMFKGGTEYDTEDLEAVAVALAMADRIVIDDNLGENK